MSKKNEYNKCPDCEQDKIYLSKAGILVCGNKKCGRIFMPCSSQQRLELEQMIYALKGMGEIQDKLIKAYEAKVRK